MVQPFKAWQRVCSQCRPGYWFSSTNLTTSMVEDVMTNPIKIQICVKGNYIKAEFNFVVARIIKNEVTGSKSLWRTGTASISHYFES